MAVFMAFALWIGFIAFVASLNPWVAGILLFASFGVLGRM